MSSATRFDHVISTRNERLGLLLVLSLAICPIVMTVGPRLLIGFLPVGIIGVLLARAFFCDEGHGEPMPDGRPLTGPWQPTFAGLLLVGLLGWAGLTILWSDRPEKSLTFWLDLSLIVGFVVLALGVSTRPLPGRLRDRLMKWFLISLVLTAGLTALNLTTGLPLFKALHDLGLMTDTPMRSISNRTLTFLILAIWPVLAWLSVSVRGPWGWIGGGVLSVSVAAAVVYGDSDAARVALVVGVLAAVVALIMPVRLLRPGLRVVIVLTVLASPWLLTHGLPQYRDALTAAPASAQARVEILALYAHPMAERPLSGWGLASATTVPKTPPPEDTSNLYRLVNPHTMTIHPHSNFVQLWVDLGLPGIVLVGALFWLSVGWITDRPDPRERVCMVGALAALLIVSSTAYGVWQADWLAQILFCVLLFRLVGGRGSPHGRADSSRPANN